MYHLCAICIRSSHLLILRPAFEKVAYWGSETISMWTPVELTGVQIRLNVAIVR